MRKRGASAYFDDITLATKRIEEHFELTRDFFNLLEHYNIKLKPDNDGIEPDPKRVEAMFKMGDPENAKELLSVIGSISYYHDYIPNLAKIIFDHEVRIDASYNGMGCVLIQNEPDGDNHYIMAAKFTKNISATGTQTKKAVVSLITNSKCSQAEFRWISALQMFDFKIENRKGKYNSDGDILSRLHQKATEHKNVALQ
ncbi:Transposon Ty3-G Gag-Pol polyprotein-like protein, partial [Leptotrombidium deliense]